MTLRFDPTGSNLFVSLFNCTHRNRKEVVVGDDNALSLTFNARNEGEGGAYEAELYVLLPPQADYRGIARNNEVRAGAERTPRTTHSSQREAARLSALL